MGNQNELEAQRHVEHVAPRELVPEPGRKTLVEAAQQSGQTRSGLQGPSCSADPAGASCFLSPEARTTLIMNYQGRVLAAQIAYTAALEELRVDELLKKEPEKSDFLVELMIEVIATVAVPALGRAVKLLRSGAAKALEHTIEDTEALSKALRSSAGEKKIESVIKSAVGMGKKNVTSALKGTDPDAHDKKAANITFLDILKTQSPVIYQSIRENALNGADDATLTILFQAFDATMGHDIGTYKDALQAKLQRFEKSRVGEIGVTDSGKRLLEIGGSGGMFWEWDTRAFWVITPLGRRLGLYRRDRQDPVVDSGSPSADEKIRKKIEGENAARTFAFIRYVPIEFEETALAMHRAQ